MDTMTARNGSLDMTELWQCIVCQQWMESGLLDNDQVCIDCDELQNDSNPDEKQEWQEFDPYC